MKCPKCEEEMEKAMKSDTLLCRHCGHTDTGMSRAEMVKTLKEQG